MSPGAFASGTPEVRQSLKHVFRDLPALGGGRRPQEMLFSDFCGVSGPEGLRDSFTCFV